MTFRMRLFYHFHFLGIFIVGSTVGRSSVLQFRSRPTARKLCNSTIINVRSNVTDAPLISIEKKQAPYTHFHFADLFFDWSYMRNQLDGDRPGTRTLPSVSRYCCTRPCPISLTFYTDLHDIVLASTLHFLFCYVFFHFLFLHPIGGSSDLSLPCELELVMRLK
jgi:hypothetical protein